MTPSSFLAVSAQAAGRPALLTSPDIWNIIDTNPALRGNVEVSYYGDARGIRATSRWFRNRFTIIPRSATREQATARIHALLERIQEEIAADNDKHRREQAEEDAKVLAASQAHVAWLEHLHAAGGLAFPNLGNVPVMTAHLNDHLTVQLPEDLGDRATFLVKLEAFLATL